MIYSPLERRATLQRVSGRLIRWHLRDCDVPAAGQFDKNTSKSSTSYLPLVFKVVALK
jgi:hypothetical protein